MIDKLTDSATQPIEEFDKINELIDNGIFKSQKLYAYKASDTDIAYSLTAIPEEGDSVYDVEGNLYSTTEEGCSAEGCYFHYASQFSRWEVKYLSGITKTVTYDATKNAHFFVDNGGVKINTGKLSTTGGTMIDTLTIEKEYGSESHLIIKYPNISNYGEDGSSGTVYPTIIEFKGGNESLGTVQYCAGRSDDSYCIELQAKKGGEATYATLEVGFDTDGNKYCSFPNTKRVDGQWTQFSQTIYSGSLKNASVLNKTVNVPNDGHVYEVLISGEVETDDATGSLMGILIKSDKLSAYASVCGERNRATHSVVGRGSVIIPIKYGSNNLTIYRSTSYNGTAEIKAIAYRRCGLNA